MNLPAKLLADFAASYDREKTLAACEPKSLAGGVIGMVLILLVPAWIPAVARHGGIHAHWACFGLFVAAVACSYGFYRTDGRGLRAHLFTAVDTILSQTALTIAVLTTVGHVRNAYAVLQGIVLLAIHARGYGLTWLFALVLAIPMVLVPMVAAAVFGVDQEVLIFSVGAYSVALWVSNVTRMERAASAKSAELRQAVVASDTVATQSLDVALTRTALTIGDTLHELRNHLGVIGSGLEFLNESTDGDPDRRGALDDSIDSYQKARSVLETAISKLKRSHSQLASPFDAIRPLRELANDSGLRALELQMQGDAELFLVRGEEEGWRMVLTNLARNALKAGARRARLVWRLETAGKSLRIDLNDDGPGISPDIAADLFKPFASKTEGGTGLGLYLSRRQIELMGGTISVSSKPGEGACFTIVLPGRVGRVVPLREQSAASPGG